MTNQQVEKSVVVKYKTQQSYCSCCNQKLPEVKTSKDKEFTIYKETAMAWIDWQTYSKYSEDMEGIVDEFVHDTIRFFAVDSYEKVIVEDSEIEKVKEFILREVVEDIQEGETHGETAAAKAE